MKFLSRARKGNSPSIKEKASAMIDRRDAYSEDSNSRALSSKELRAPSWKNGLGNEKEPQHCMSFLTKGALARGGKRRSIQDEESTQSKPITVVSSSSTPLNIIDDDTTRVRAKMEEPETRDPHPSSVAEHKEQTMRLINKGVFGLGRLKWAQAEEQLRFWTHQGSEESVHLSIILLDRMVEEHEKAPKWSDQQMIFWLKALVQNWNKGQREHTFETFSPKDMIEQIEAWYQCIELDPDLYSSIIDGAAYSQPHLADALLRRTVESHHKGLVYSHTYNQVLKAWVDAKDPYQAEALLDFMLSEWRNRREGSVNIAAKPNRQSFHWVLLAWANSSERVASQRTEQILEKMEMYSKSGALASVKPNAATYKWVLDSLITAPNRSPEDNAERAENILNVLQDKADKGDEDFRPTTEMYSAVVAAWGKACEPDRGEELLHRLYRDYCDRNHDKRLQPDLKIFNHLLMGWATVSKTARRRAGERAEAILEHMEKLSSTNVLPGVKPDLQSYNTLLDCWSRCGDGEKAQDLLETMIERWETGDDIIAPDTVSYSRVLSAWSRAGGYERCEHIIDVLHKQFMDLNNYRVHPNLILGGLARFGTQPQASRKAKRLFRKMEDLSLAGNRDDLKPTTTSYRHLLDCIYQSDRSQSGCQAEAVLNEMIAKHATGDEDVKPDVACYNLVMKALVKSKQPRRTEEVLAQMGEEDNRGARVYPNLETFNTILLAWAKSGLGEEACKRAEQILRRLERIHESRILKDVKPDIVSYNTALECFTQTPAPYDAGERAEHILEQMQDKGGVEPNATSYNRVIVALKNCGEAKRAKQLLKMIKKNVSGDEDDLDLLETLSIQWF